MDAPRFRGGRPQKLAPRRKVAEKVGYSDGGARRGALRARSNFFAPLELDLVGGVGLGNMWGEQKALEMMGEAGFTNIDVAQVDGDIFNNYYIATKG